MNTAIDRAALEKEGWLVIESDLDKMTFSPKEPLDECWSGVRGKWLQVNMAEDGFVPNVVYRRRIAQPAPVAATPWNHRDSVKPTLEDSDISGCVLYRSLSGCVAAYPYNVKPPIDCLFWMSPNALPPLPAERKKTQEMLMAEAAEAIAYRDFRKAQEIINELTK